MGSLVIRGVNSGPVLVDNQLGNLFADGSIGDGLAYAFVEVANTHPTMGVTGLTLYVAITDLGGGGYALAAADGANARSSTYTYTLPAGAGLTFTTATTPTSGQALPNLSAGQKYLLCVRRDLTTGAAAWPETNAIGVGYTSPVGYA